MGRDTRKYSFSAFYGVNEAPEGDSSLKGGEAAEMRNFAVTRGGALTKRGGTGTVLTLASDYMIKESGETFTETEWGTSTKELELYPRITVDSDGWPALEGDAVTVDCDNAADYKGYYGYSEDMYYFRLDNVSYTGWEAIESEDITYKGESSEDWSGSSNTYLYCWFYVYDSVLWNGESWETEGGELVTNAELTGLNGKYVILDETGVPVTFFLMKKNAPEEADFEELYNAEGLFGILSLTEDTESYVSDDDDPLWVLYLTVAKYREANYVWGYTGLISAENSCEDSTVKALWSGFVGGEEVLCAACAGHLWSLSCDGEDVWSSAACGSLDTDSGVHMFGFEGKLYIMNGSEYKVWDGEILRDVEGYRPLVTITVLPSGGGVTLEQVNKLNGLRRSWFSPDGESTVFTLPESGLESLDWVRDLTSGEYITGYTYDLEEGTVTFGEAPEAGVDTIEIAWTYPESYRDEVTAMRFSELYNGTQDTRVFIYGDGSSTALYSGLDYDGRPRADYFPDMNECAVGDENTPITAMIRHYNRLLCFKKDSAWSIYYDSITLTDGSVTAGFYVTPVNRSIGSCAYGEVRLVENRPRTLDGRSVIEWKSTSTSGNITGDARNAQVVSQRVDRTIRTFDLEEAVTFYDKITREYYVVEGGTALVNNVEADVWYIYTDFDAASMVCYKDNVYLGSGDGKLKRFSSDYLSDDGESIDCYWESGAMSFGDLIRRKYSQGTMLGIKAEEKGYLEVTCMTDRRSLFRSYEVRAPSDGLVPRAEYLKLRPGKFTYMKLIFENNTSDRRVTVVDAEITVESAGNVR